MKQNRDHKNVRHGNLKKLLPVMFGVIAVIVTTLVLVVANHQNASENMIDRETINQPELPPLAIEALANQKMINNCPSCSIAVVKPVFTHSAYQPSAFYTFYELHEEDDVTKNDLSMLTTKVKNGWGQSRGALIYFYPMIENNTINVITGVDVHNDNITQYDKLILTHSEYVTQQYYDNLRRFVESGGTLILFDANSLYAEVVYDDPTNTITLKKGHHWSFDGTKAEKSVGSRWKQENREFIGSNYAGTGKYDEQNVMKNPDAECLHEWDTLPTGKVCAYKLAYGDGLVYHTGVFASWHMHKEPKLQELVEEFLGP